MSADDITVSEWGVRLPNGEVLRCSGPGHAGNEAISATSKLQQAGSAETAEVVSRLKSVTYSEWERGESDD